MKQYIELLTHVLNNGKVKEDRTGTGTRSVFGWQSRYDISTSFPLVTTKKVHLKSVIYELLWFLKGETNVKYLTENGVSIWKEWANEKGELGPVYGKQWRCWEKKDGSFVDQIKDVIGAIKNNPDSRRHIVSAWNVGEIDQMALPPCHSFFQFYVINETLSCQLYQRSADVFLGVPFNIASYSLLTMMVAQVCNLKPAEFIHVIGDAHLYSNHIEQANIQIAREPKELPIMKINPVITDIDEFEYNDFELLEYFPHERIIAPIAI